MTQSGPQGREWADVVEVLHALNNLVTVRSHYAEGHPAIARADDLAAGLFGRLLARMPELVLALIDGEFVVSERPMPDLRDRIEVLATAMVRHEVECIVIQRGVTSAECTVMGRLLAAPKAEPRRAHEQARANLVHVGFRFAEKRKKGEVGRGAQDAMDFVQPVHALLGDVARAVATKTLADREAVRAIAAQMVASCDRRSFVLQQRCHVEDASNDAGHAVNVAMITASMALAAGLGEPECVEATAAALLHDVGHLFLPAAVRGVPEPLLDAEGRATFRHHPYVGASSLLAAGCPALWVAVALEHHRGIDGKGYPARDAGGPPHPTVSLVALANYVERRCTLLRGQADTPDRALAQAVALQDVYFGRPAIEAFVRALGVFPPGTTVELSDRRAALVVAANPGDPRRPVVRILGGADDDKRLDLKQLDAVEGRHLASIVRAIPPPVVPWVPDADTLGEADSEPSSQPEPEPAPAPVLPSLRPLARGLSMPPAARVSGLYSSVPKARGTSSKPPADAAEPRLAPKITVPPRITSSAPPAGAGASTEDTERECLAVLGSLDRVPRVVAAGDLGKRSLDHRAGFVLTFVDGMSSIDTILDASGLPRLEVLRILRDLVQAGVVAV
jgi:HD-GYP domain-containing protein (c-di-GMP phosphodiesterase class II)